MAKREIKQVGVVKPNFSRLKLTSKNYNANFWKALTYAQEVFDLERLKKETLQWAKDNNHDVAALKKVDKAYFATVGKVFYMLNNEGEITDKVRGTTMEMFNDLLERGKKDTNKVQALGEEELAQPETPAKPKKQVEAEEAASKTCAVIDDFVDQYIGDEMADITKTDTLRLMHRCNVDHLSAVIIMSAYASDLAELQAVLSGDDPELTEGYAGHSKIKIKRMVRFYESLNTSAQTFIDAHNEVLRSKQKTPAELVSKLRYKKRDDSLKIKSMDVKEIIGASKVWIFNTKTRKIGAYVAKDTLGLSIKGSVVENYDEDASVERTLPKFRDNITLFTTKSSKKLSENYMTLDSLEIKLNGRINEHCVILRIEK